MKVKICGITRLEDALCAADNGAYALGFNFHPASPRYITPKKAQMIIKELPPHIMTVGIFIQHSDHEICNTMDAIGLNFGQIYHDPDCPNDFKKRLILSLGLTKIEDLPSEKILQNYAYLLLDAPPINGSIGGTGHLSNWSIGKDLAKKYRLILAGGLNTENIEQAIQTVQPCLVDIASGIECSPGIKDHHRMTSFLRRAHHAQ